MNRGALVGGVLGVVVLAFLGGYWLANPASHSASTADASRSAVGAPSAAPGGQTPQSNTTRGAEGAPAAAGTPQAPWQNPPAAGAAGSADTAAPAGAAQVPPLSREERRKVRDQVRKKLAELQAKGPNVTIAEVQSLMDEVEALGRGVFDPRYFQTMRQMLEKSARVQALGKELQAIAPSSAPKDVARRQQILAEMRNLSDQISQGAVALQGYANATLAQPAKQP